MKGEGETGAKRRGFLKRNRENAGMKSGASRYSSGSKSNILPDLISRKPTGESEQRARGYSKKQRPLYSIPSTLDSNLTANNRHERAGERDDDDDERTK